MAKKDEWWTTPTESEDGRRIIVTGRRGVEKFRDNPRFNIRIEVTWRYEGDSDGMPRKADGELMEQVTDALNQVFKKDPVAVMTGIYTGDNRRDWVFYTTSTFIFQKKINEALADMPVLPLTIYAENDPQWAEYDEMREATEIPDEEEFD